MAYSEKVMDHFRNPRNVGEMKDPDGIGKVGNPVCGDIMELYIRVKDDVITDAKFQTLGCGAAIATSSMMTDLVIGKKIEDAKTISNQAVAEALGGLPAQKMHCSVMGREALEAAIANYRGEKIPEKEEGKLVCKCFDVSEEKIRKVAIENHLTTVDEITNFTKAGGGCGECIPQIEAGHKPPEEIGVLFDE